MTAIALHSDVSWRISWKYKTDMDWTQNQLTYFLKLERFQGKRLNNIDFYCLEQEQTENYLKTEILL